MEPDADPKAKSLAHWWVYASVMLVLGAIGVSMIWHDYSPHATSQLTLLGAFAAVFFTAAGMFGVVISYVVFCVLIFRVCQASHNWNRQ